MILKKVDEHLTTQKELVQRAMTSNLTLEHKQKFLELMNGLGAHSMYYPEPVAKQLSECGISTKVSDDGKAILIGDIRIDPVEPEWGEKGIYPPHILSVVINDCGYEFKSDMTGIGFRFRDFLTQLAYEWGVEKNYI